MNNEQRGVVRFVITFVDDHHMRRLALGAQGRYTFATPAEAYTCMRNILSNTPASVIEQLWGFDPQFDVRACECWPVHFDPKGIYFNE